MSQNMESHMLYLKLNQQDLIGQKKTSHTHTHSTGTHTLFPVVVKQQTIPDRLRPPGVRRPV